MSIVYQGGPMRDLPLYNYQAFEDGKTYLGKMLGHTVHSPHDLDIMHGFVETVSHHYENEYFVWQREFESVKLTDKFSMEAALRVDLPLIAASDIISFLPGWETSRGCAIELQVALWCDVDVYVHEPWKYFREMSREELFDGRIAHALLGITDMKLAA